MDISYEKYSVSTLVNPTNGRRLNRPVFDSINYLMPITFLRFLNSIDLILEPKNTHFKAQFICSSKYRKKEFISLVEATMI